MKRDIKIIKGREDLDESDIGKLVLIGPNKRKSVIIEITENELRSIETISICNAELGICRYSYVRRPNGNYTPVLCGFERQIKPGTEEYEKYANILMQKK